MRMPIIVRKRTMRRSRARSIFLIIDVFRKDFVEVLRIFGSGAVIED